MLENCSEDCDGIAVIKICDSALVDGDDEASLFDDDNNDENDNEDTEFIRKQSSVGNDLTVSIDKKNNKYHRLHNINIL